MEEKKSVLKSFGKEILIGVTVTLFGLVFSNYKSWSTKDFTPTRPRLQRGRSRIAFVMLFEHLNKLHF